MKELVTVEPDSEETRMTSPSSITRPNKQCQVSISQLPLITKIGKFNGNSGVYKARTLAALAWLRDIASTKPLKRHGALPRQELQQCCWFWPSASSLLPKKISIKSTVVYWVIRDQNDSDKVNLIKRMRERFFHRVCDGNVPFSTSTAMMVESASTNASAICLPTRSQYTCWV